MSHVRTLEILACQLSFSYNLLALSIQSQHMLFVTRLGGFSVFKSKQALRCEISRDGAPQQALRRNGATLLKFLRFRGLHMPLTSRNIVFRREGVVARALILIW